MPQAVDLDLIFWESIQEGKEKQQEFETRLDVIEAEVQKYGRIWRTTKKIFNFTLNHGGQLIKALGWAIFAVTGATGQWPKLAGWLLGIAK